MRIFRFRDGGPFSGPVEVDETYMGGKRKNRPKFKREQMSGRGAVGETAVVATKVRATKQVAAKVVRSTDKVTLQEFVEDHAGEDETVYTNDASAYETLKFDHDSVNLYAASVLCRSRVSLAIGVTGSHVPHKSPDRVLAASMPYAARAVHRCPSDWSRGRTPPPVLTPS